MNRPHLPLIAFRCYQRPCVVGDPTHGSARSSSSVEHPVQEGVRGGQLLSRQLSVVSLPLAYGIEAGFDRELVPGGMVEPRRHTDPSPLSCASDLVRDRVIECNRKLPYGHEPQR